MKNLLVKTTKTKKALSHGLWTATLIGFALMFKPTNAKASNDVHSTLHTCSIDLSFTALDSNEIALHENETPKEIEYRKPRKRKRRRRRRFLRRKSRDQ
ncbi:MAG: hypothetical protein L7V85_00465 [Bacteroidia bacterium]|nr:hypothetical protein [Bacteroidia bacterium]